VEISGSSSSSRSRIDGTMFTSLSILAISHNHLGSLALPQNLKSCQ
jgi:hypothetical protein